MSEPERESLQQLRQALETIEAFDIEGALVREEVLGRAFSFADGRSLFVDAKGLAEQLRGLRLEDLPDSSAGELTSSLTRLQSALADIASFDPNIASPAPRREELLTRLRDQVEQVRSAAMLPIAFLSLSSINLRDQSSRLEALLKESHSKVETALKAISERETEAATALNAIRAAAAASGAGQFTVTFENEAREQSRQADYWLKRAIGAGTATLVVAVAGLAALIAIAATDHAMEPEVAIQVALGKAAILAIGAYATVTFNGLSKAHRHLEAVNKHRSNALRVFQAFVEATPDRQIKDAVLLEASHTIFGSSVTGFLDGSAEPDRVEISRALTGFVTPAGQ